MSAISPQMYADCQESCCQLKQQQPVQLPSLHNHTTCHHLPWGVPQPCLDAHEGMQECCQHYLCECNQPPPTDSYREQEPPKLHSNKVAPQKTAQPKSPFTMEDDQSDKFCPACAGLAVAAAADGSEFNHPIQMKADGTDPDAALVDVWASAARASPTHYNQNSITRFQRRREQAFMEQKCRGVGQNADCRTLMNSPSANVEDLIVECINSEMHKNHNGGFTRTCSDRRRFQSNYVKNSDIYCRDSPDTEHCQQCDAEAAILNRDFDGCSGKTSTKPDIRIMRRVATVARDIDEIVRGIRYFQRKNENKQRVNKIVNEWRIVGGVLDRLFFICYLFAISLSIMLYFPRPADELALDEMRNETHNSYQ